MSDKYQTHETEKFIKRKSLRAKKVGLKREDNSIDLKKFKEKILEEINEEYYL